MDLKALYRMSEVMTYWIDNGSPCVYANHERSNIVYCYVMSDALSQNRPVCSSLGPD